MKCEYCNQKMKQIKQEDHDKVWNCNCELFRQEQKLQDKIEALEREIRIAKQEVMDIHRQSLFMAKIIKLNETYGKNIIG